MLLRPGLKRIVIGLCVAAGTVLILALYFPGLRPQPKPTTVATGEASIGGPFTLVDAKGNTVTEAVLKGHYSLVYFGFTQCPDICPIAMSTITEALQTAGPVAETVVPVFISVDPEHDTPQIMADYVVNFHPRFVALTGTAEQIEQASRGYRVYAAKQTGTAPGEYSMAHSDFIYLMGPDGHYVGHFRRDATALDIASRLRRELLPK